MRPAVLAERLPQGRAAVHFHGPERIGVGEPFQRRPPEAGSAGEVGHRAVWSVGPSGDDRVRRRGPQPADEAKAEAETEAEDIGC